MIDSVENKDDSRDLEEIPEIQSKVTQLRSQEKLGKQGFIMMHQNYLNQLQDSERNESKTTQRVKNHNCSYWLDQQNFLWVWYY